MAECVRINLQQPCGAGLDQFSLNLDRFRNEFAQRVASQSASIKTDQQELFPPVGRNQDRRNPSTQTASRTIAVKLSLSGIHNSQIALAVYDFASDRHSSQVASGLLHCWRGVDHSDGAGVYFHHGSALTIDQLALQTDLFAIEA